MLGVDWKTLLLIAVNAFTDAIAIAILGVASEVIYRLFVWLGVLNGGREFLPLLGCLGVAAVLVLVRLPKLIRLLRSKRA